MTPKPMRNLVMVEVVEHGFWNTTTESGIITRAENENVGFGIVHGVGPEFKGELALGDKVIYGRYAGQDYKRPEDEKLFRFLAEKDLHCVIE